MKGEAAPTAAQDAGGDRASKLRIVLLVGAIVSNPSNAETWRVTPSLSVAETLTDNVDLAPGDRKKSDLITQVSPGIRVTGTGARLKLNLNYRVQQFLYASDADRNSRQNFLDAVANLEAVQNWLFVDATARITQQSVSAFGAQPTSDGNVNSNRSEASAYSLSPHIRGRIGATADYQLRYRYTTASTSGTQLGDTDLSEWLGKISGNPGGSVGWIVDGLRQTTKPDAARSSERSRLVGSALYRYDPQWRFTASAGQEWNNFSGTATQTTLYGGRVEWTPSPRTQLSAYKEIQSFGNRHDFTLTHRTRLTTWQFSDRKDVTTLPNQLITENRGAAFELLNNYYSSSIPDPTARALEVERLLQQSAIPADLAQAAGLLTTRVFVQRSRRASVIIRGARNTVALAAGLNDSTSITGSSAPATQDDLSRSPEVQQRSLTASWAYQLSGLTTMNVLATQIQTTSVGPTNLESTQSTYRVLLSHRINPKMSGTLSARMVRFSTTTGPGFGEKALMASLNVAF